MTLADVTYKRGLGLVLVPARLLLYSCLGSNPLRCSGIIFHLFVHGSDSLYGWASCRCECNRAQKEDGDAEYDVDCCSFRGLILSMKQNESPLTTQWPSSP